VRCVCRQHWMTMRTANSGVARRSPNEPARGGDYRGTGGHVPQHFGWGDAKVNVPPSLIAHLVKFLGHIFHLDKISFQHHGSYVPGPRWGSAPKPPTIQKKSPPLEPAELSQ